MSEHTPHTHGGTDAPECTPYGTKCQPVILCVSPSGCTCGAPADTPAGMHHCDCAVHPGWCGDPQCRACVENGKVRR